MVYVSSYPTPIVPNVSLFTQLLSLSPDGFVGGYPASYPAFIDADTGITITRGRFRHLALTFAYGLANHPAITLQRGDTVMLYSPNSLAYPVILYGVVAAGMRITLANSAYTSGELKHQFQDSGAKLVLATKEGLSVVLDMFKKCGVARSEALKNIIIVGEDLNWANGSPVPLSGAESLFFEGLLSLGTLLEEERFDDELANESVYLCYSSGTTGKPKGVETTHRNLVSVMKLGDPVFPKTDPLTSKFIGALPFYHIFGASVVINLPLLRGVPLVIMSKFDPVQFCAHIQKYRITGAPVVPPIILFLAKHPVVAKFDLSSLRVLFCAAAPLSSVHVLDVTQRLLNARGDRNLPLEIIQAYGLTETSPAGLMLPSGQSLRKAGSVGLLLPGLKSRIVTDDGQDAPAGKPGELWLHGPLIMKGYLNNPLATAASITPDGWLKTGDIVTRDSEGYHYVVDRKKELIKYKGFQVSPAEIEGILTTHPKIADAAVIGIESLQQATELPRAYVVHANQSELEDKQKFAADVAEWIQSRVARHKYLRGGVVVVDAVPRSAAGKILRRQLRDMVEAPIASRL